MAVKGSCGRTPRVGKKGDAKPRRGSGRGRGLGRRKRRK